MTNYRLTLAALLLAGTIAAAAQTAPPDATPPPSAVPATPVSQPAPAPTQTAAASPAPAALAAPAAAPNIILVPAGTKVLLEVRSAINTKSARPGDGVYLYSIFPVVVGARVVIPSGVYVQGVVDSVVRPGRGVGAKKAQLNMHFTSMIFSNGSVVEIPGVVNSMPGAEHQKVNGDEGTIEQDGGSNKAHNAGETAKVAVPTGATIGSIGGLEGGHPLAGGLEGAGAGLAAAGIVALFTRGADVNIPSGTQVEMVLQRPLQVQEANINGPTSLVPASSQQQPLPKPHREQILCPTGSLGCS
jgi:type IV secretion system protein VirB10